MGADLEKKAWTALQGRVDSGARSAQKLDSNGRLKCRACHGVFPFTSFYRNANSRAAVAGICKPCKSLLGARWRSTLGGFVRSRLGAAAAHTRQMLLSGRTGAGHFGLEFSGALDLLLQQQGRCAYSGVVMSLAPHTHWQASLERLDNDLGYSVSNVRWVALEFQTRAQWSNSKMIYASRMGNRPLLHDSLAALQQRHVHAHCRKLLKHARSSAHLRRKNGRVRAGIMELTLDDLLVMYTRQRGLCAVSGMPLCMSSGTNWSASLERADNSEGYMVSNCSLICLEFQTADNSACASLEVLGTPQWSRSKFDYVYTRCRTHSTNSGAWISS